MKRSELWERQARACGCGSGLDRLPVHDGYNIFLTYTCPACHDRVMKAYRPDIMERYECDEPIEED